MDYNIINLKFFILEKQNICFKLLIIKCLEKKNQKRKIDII